MKHIGGCCGGTTIFQPETPEAEFLTKRCLQCGASELTNIPVVAGRIPELPPYEHLDTQTPFAGLVERCLYFRWTEPEREAR